MTDSIEKIHSDLLKFCRLFGSRHFNSLDPYEVPIHEDTTDYDYFCEDTKENRKAVREILGTRLTDKSLRDLTENDLQDEDKRLELKKTEDRNPLDERGRQYKDVGTSFVVKTEDGLINVIFKKPSRWRVFEFVMDNTSPLLFTKYFWKKMGNSAEDIQHRITLLEDFIINMKKGK